MPNLTDSVHALPPELFAQIRDLVLTFDSITTVIDEDYKPPLQLQLNAITRRHAASIFYQQTMFSFYNPAIFLKWLSSVSETYLDMVKAITIHVQLQPVPKDFEARQALYSSIDVQHYCRMARSAVKSTTAGRMVNFQQQAIQVVFTGSEKAATSWEWSNNYIGLRWSKKRSDFEFHLW